MSYMLEMYSLDWKALGEVFGSGNKILVGQIDKQFGEQFFRGSPTAEHDRAVWRGALDALIGGRRGQELVASGPQGPGVPEQVTDSTALALAGIIRTVGDRVGEMEHSTSSGDFFRDEFLAREAPAILRTTINLGLLVSRPLFGLEHDLYPSWGGLTKMEIPAVVGSFSTEKPPEANDSDIEGWLYDLIDSLDAVRQNGADLVTLYL